MLRGREVTRIEGFSDAVFGFTLTLLVVSLEVPDDFDGLLRILVGFPAFAVTFAVICWVWFEHYLLFRKLDLDDGVSAFLNCVLLFIVVFYAYPLKFLFTRLITGSMLGQGTGIDQGMTAEHGQVLMAVYSGGFVAVFATFVLLYWNAWRQRDALGLDALTLYDTRAGMRRHAISVAIGMLSVLMTIALPIRYLPYAGMIYFLMGPAHGTFGYINGRRRERLEASLAASRPASPDVEASEIS